MKEVHMTVRAGLVKKKQANLAREEMLWLRLVSGEEVQHKFLWKSANLEKFIYLGSELTSGKSDWIEKQRLNVADNKA